MASHTPHPISPLPESNAEPSRRLLITVHGIRTFGSWQDQLGTKLNQLTPERIDICHYRYGFFTILAFLVPPFRWLATKRFKSVLINQIGQQSWSRIDIVAHSFGTHLVGWALLRILPTNRPRINTLIFCGSVLKANFQIHELLTTCVSR